MARRIHRLFEATVHDDPKPRDAVSHEQVTAALELLFTWVSLTWSTQWRAPQVALSMAGPYTLGSRPCWLDVHAESAAVLKHNSPVLQWQGS